MNASVRITRDTTFHRHDEAAPAPSTGRVVWLEIGDSPELRVSVELPREDEDLVIATSALIEELDAVRAAAARRLAFRIFAVPS